MGNLVTLALVIGGSIILIVIARWLDRRRDVSAEYHAEQLRPKPPIGGGNMDEPDPVPVYRWVPHAVDQTRDLLHSEAPSDDVDDNGT